MARQAGILSLGCIPIGQVEQGMRARMAGLHEEGRYHVTNDPFGRSQRISIPVGPALARSDDCSTHGGL